MNCYYCNREFLPLEDKFIVKVQRFKYGKRVDIGKCCEECAFSNETDIKLWRGVPNNAKTL